MKQINSLPPGPRSRWPGRQLKSFLKDAPDYLLGMAARYGDVSYFSDRGFSFFLLNHPDHIKDVLVTRQHLFQKGEVLRRAKFLFGDGLLTSEGEFHDRQRRLILPAFHRRRFAHYCELMSERAARRRERWQDGGEVDIDFEMRQLTLLIVCEALFGADVESDATEVAEVVSDVLTRFVPFSVPPTPAARLLRRLAAGRVRRRVTTARDRLNPIIYRIIAARRTDGRDRDDLLSMLLRAEVESGEGGAPMSDRQVRDEVITLFLAGHETTANSLTWALHMLSRRPEAQARLQAEVDSALGGRPPTGEDLPRLPYTAAVLNEAMRLYPPVWMISRTASQDFEVGGYAVPGGSLVVMCQFVTHRDERYYTDPLRFDPERWTREARGARPEFSYFPFGGGKRRCIGEGFALAEGVVLLASFAQRWHFSKTSDAPLRYRAGLVLRPVHGQRLRVERRGA